ncbi:granulocyte-macrophage colony-stimulating factor receptor subunit alpha-like isoform X1 [Pezoporus wallicus]|nr:granulocyte-macrophage colony-stimulating factor receptor subunit alpha-like isoform X1 [Pezoporus wallicus]XP_057267610.1 granulocyte-macrophage colony-stimulating factor receptor subunit alpha-like isoform X1 [Pezoporus wallicus]XP_061315789.1 granulocyte-macrophage colony-stimulating factor receptor subunit alpha-like isoform X3 [Pezoporus flaviventris]XP_061315790.1 granulocyte-macrophage colony-stimulating factor receptor subunit alpha-like isoform X3 [Pezoporus flaviventris]
MFDTLGLICMMWCYMMLFHPLHADIQYVEPEAQESPIANVKMNWRKMELTWDSSKNFSKYKCTIMDRDIESIQTEVDSPLCRFPVELYLPLHKGVFLTIEVPNTNISKTFTFIPGGMNGSAIENFSCVIYNISLMSCTWQAGKDAPGDTQYFLYWQNSRYDDAMECELYIKDENGRNTGCRFQNVRIETEKAYFLVNGSSKDSLIQFYDEYIQLYKIEILTPPLNVTVNCTGDSAGCIITWQAPLTSHVENIKCFQYEISIQNKDEPKEQKKDPPVKVRSNRYEFQNYNEEKKYILKIRARGKNCLVSSNWGEWSEPIEFGQGKDHFPLVILFLIALGTISVTLLQYCLFKRYCNFKSLFSPIPQPRDKFNASTDEDNQVCFLLNSKLLTIKHNRPKTRRTGI